MLYVGCYTSASGGNGTGITALRQEASGELTRVGEVAMTSPSWLVRHPSAPVLYAANETGDGAVTTVALAGLEILDTVPSGGADPCHLAITPDQRFLLCANYSSGSLAVFGLAEDGRITGRSALVTHSGSGPVPDRQDAAHVHMAVPLSVSPLPPGTGPRQLVRRPGTDLAYVPGELAGTVVTVRESPAGTFTPVGTSPATARPHPGGTNHVAHAMVVEDRLYVSNRGPDCLTEFDLAGPTPRPVRDHPCGAFPRHFTVTGGTCHAAAQKGDAIVSFPLAGGPATRFATGSPTCVVVG